MNMTTKYQTIQGLLEALDYGDQRSVAWHLSEGEDALAQQIVFELAGLRTEVVHGGNLGIIVVSL